MKLNEILNEHIDVSEPYHWFKADVEAAYKDTLNHIRQEPDDFRGYFLNILRGRMDGTLGVVIKSEFGLSHDPAYQTIFLKINTRSDIHRPHGEHTLFSGHRHTIHVDIPASWAPDDVADFTPYKMRQREREATISQYSHEIARTMAHELIHMHQSRRVQRKNLSWSREADLVMMRRGIDWDTLSNMTKAEKATKWPEAMGTANSNKRYLSKEDETWGLPHERDAKGNPANHYDQSLLNADYLTKKDEVDAHANNAALDILHRNNWDLAAAKSYLTTVLKRGTTPADDNLHSYYEHIRANKWVDTKQAWTEYLKRVYQRMTRLKHNQSS